MEVQNAKRSSKGESVSESPLSVRQQIIGGLLIHTRFQPGERVARLLFTTVLNGFVGRGTGNR